jgi:hypothetical protein
MQEIKGTERGEINGESNLRGQWHERPAPNYCTYSGPLLIVPFPGFTQHFSLLFFKGRALFWHSLLQIYQGGGGGLVVLSKGTVLCFSWPIAGSYLLFLVRKWMGEEKEQRETMDGKSP